MNKNIIGGKFFYDTNFLKKKKNIKGSFFYNGRSALFDLLKNKSKINRFKKIFLPAFTCKSLIEVAKKQRFKIVYYSLNSNFTPNLTTQKDSLLLLIDYFGINCSQNITLSNDLHSNQVIVDKSHTFLNKHRSNNNFNFFFSLRKFSFLNGGFHNGSTQSKQNNKVNKLFNQIIETQKEKANYIKDIEENRNIKYEKALIHKFEDLEKKLISNSNNVKANKVLRDLYKTYNWNFIIKRRKKNFEFLVNELKNKFEILNYNNLKENKTPIFLVLKLCSSRKRDIIRDRLIKNDIFPPIIWPKIKSLNYKKFKFENDLCTKTLCLPIDQRYDIKNMSYINEKIKEII